MKKLPGTWFVIAAAAGRPGLKRWAGTSGLGDVVFGRLR